MSLIELKGEALSDMLRAGYRQVATDIREATSKARETGIEYRDRIFKGFLTIFDAVRDNSHQGEKPRYHVTPACIAQDTGYSVTMVNHYRTIAENMALSVQIGETPGEVTETPEGKKVQGEAVPVFEAVQNLWAVSDIGDLSSLIRKTNNRARGGRKAIPALTLGARAAKNLLTKPEAEITAWLEGFCKGMSLKPLLLNEAVAQFAPLTAPAVEAPADPKRGNSNSKGKKNTPVIHEEAPQALGLA